MGIYLGCIFREFGVRSIGSNLCCIFREFSAGSGPKTLDCLRAAAKELGQPIPGSGKQKKICRSIFFPCYL